MIEIIQPIFRVCAGITLVLVSIYFAHRYQIERYQDDHNRYVNCVRSGQKPKLCSISAVFSPDKFNARK